MSTGINFTAGNVLTAAQMDNLSQGILDYQSSTSNASATSGTTEATLLTATALTPAQTGRRWKLSFHTRGISGTVNNDTFIIRFKEGATVLNEIHWIDYVSGATLTGVAFFHIINSPTVASHTYSVTIQRATGTGTATVTATATAPMFLIVEDCGEV